MSQQRRLPVWIENYVPPELQSSILFQFKLKLPNDQTIDVDLRQDLDVDYEQLETQMMDIPAQFMFWGSVHSEMKQMAAIMERRVKARRGIIMDQAVQMAKAAGCFKLTDTQLKVIVEKDHDLNKLEEALAVVEKQAGKLWYMTEALKMKAEHLRSLAGFKKQEINNQR